MEWPELAEHLRTIDSKDLPKELAPAWSREHRVPIEPIAYGQSNTSTFLDCPNVPAHHHQRVQEIGPSHWDEFGGYQWFDFKLTDDDGRARKLRLVFNDGDADTNDGRWGGVWDVETAARLADLTSTGDCETTITERDELGGGRYSAPTRYVFSEETDAAFFADIPFARDIRLGRDSAFERVVLLAMRWAGHILRVGL